MDRLVLEYRLLKEDGRFEKIYHVVFEKDREEAEIICRRNCEYQIISGKKYENIGGAQEPDGLFVLYLKEVPGVFYPHLSLHKDLGIEIRLPQGGEIAFLSYENHLKLMMTLDNSFLYLNKKEYRRLSAEFDQERRVYLMYMEPTGVYL